MATIDKEKEAESRRRYYQSHKPQEKERHRMYYQEHKAERAIKAGRYYQSHKMQCLEKNRRHYQANKTARLEYHRQYRQAHKKEIVEKSKQYRQSHNLQIRQHYKIRQPQLRLEVLTHYGNGKCACMRCGYNDIRALTIDHLNGNGAEHRRMGLGTGSDFYGWLKRNGYPKEYQTLCFNCNWIKAIEEKEVLGKKLASVFEVNNNSKQPSLL